MEWKLWMYVITSFKCVYQFYNIINDNNRNILWDILFLLELSNNIKGKIHKMMHNFITWSTGFEYFTE